MYINILFLLSLPSFKIFFFMCLVVLLVLIIMLGLPHTSRICHSLSFISFSKFLVIVFSHIFWASFSLYHLWTSKQTFIVLVILPYGSWINFSYLSTLDFPFFLLALLCLFFSFGLVSWKNEIIIFLLLFSEIMMW